MIAPWLVWGLTMLGWLAVSIGAYLLGHHRGYLAGLHERVASLPGDPWRPPTEGEFLAEMLERERKSEPPRKYRREP